MPVPPSAPSAPSTSSTSSKSSKSSARALARALARGLLLTCALALALPLFAACSSIQTQRRDWSTYDGPGAQYFHQEEAHLPQGIRDPGQPFNRGLLSVNDWLVKWVVSPISVGWRFVFPQSLRKRFGMVGDNLAFPTRALNDLAQGQGGAAGTETARFLINTVVGLLGFFDPADSWGLKAPHEEDTGQSLQAAGWKDPAYVFLPLQGPSTTRDTVGLVGDTVTNIGFWISPFVSIFFHLNNGSDAVLGYEQLVETDPDPYRMARLAWSVLRSAQVEHYPTEVTDGAADQTLQAVFMRPAEPTFFRSGDEGEVLIPSTGRLLPYTYWLQPHEAPVLYIIPGLGSHRLSNQPLAMADAALQNGWSVVVISSTLHPEFMGAGSSAPVPGFAPVDSHDVRVAFDAIDRQLAERHPGRLGKRALSGLSMGAFHTLYIAAEQEQHPDDGLLRFDQFALGAPPVSLGYGVGQLDAFYNAPMAWPAEERDSRIIGALQRVAALADGDLTPGKPLPFSEEQARFIVGLNFRITLVDVLWASQQREDRGVLLTPRDPDDREPAYREMLDYSWMEYFYAFVVPWLVEAGLATDAEDALAQCDLRSIEASLERCVSVHVYMSDNDFLRRPEDTELLRRIFPPERLRVSEGGAHLGNGWKADELGQIMAELKARLAAGEASGAAP